VGACRGPPANHRQSSRGRREFPFDEIFFMWIRSGLGVDANMSARRTSIEERPRVAVPPEVPA
jgi:hypothetical protein